MQENINFEKALKELEEIVHRLEKEDIPLEDALKTFEKGINISRKCAMCLDAAERRIEELTTTEKGEPGFKSFEDEAK
jgi:exodeoxyribonuclease VII small subunit